MLYGAGDVQTCRYFIENTEPNPQLTPEQNEMFRQREEERLKHMIFYCRTSNCLRNYMLRYFGDEAEENCGKCSNCLTKFETVDVTIEAQKILSCIIRTGQNIDETNSELFDALKVVRTYFAMKRGVPAYIIFSDATLADMCKVMPTTPKEFLRVKGVTGIKLEKYGEAFMRVIKEYGKSDNDEKSKKYDVAEMRANGLTGAYEPWTEKETVKLRFEYELGIPIDKIAKNHGRTKEAIRSRLKKEGLIEE